MNTGFGAADAADQPDALQHLGQFRQVGRAQFGQVGDGAAGRVDMDHEHGDDGALAVGVKRGGDGGAVDRPALAPGGSNDAPAQGFGLHRPAFGKVAGAGNQHRASRRQQVLPSSSRHHRRDRPLEWGAISGRPQSRPVGKMPYPAIL